MKLSGAIRALIVVSQINYRSSTCEFADVVDYGSGNWNRKVMNIKWAAQKLVTPFVLSLCTFLSTHQFKENLPISIGIAMFGVAWIWIVEFIVRPGLHDRKVLEAFLSGYLEVIEVDSAKVRCCLWVPDPHKSEHLKVVTNYVPKAELPSLRTMHVSKGIVGKAYRTETVETLILENSVTEEKYRELLVSDYGLTRLEARAVSPNRRGFITIPVRSSNTTISGIIYIDSADSSVVRNLLREDNIDKLGRVAKLLEPLLRTMEGKPQ